MIKTVIKRDGTEEPFNIEKIHNAVDRAFHSCSEECGKEFYTLIDTLDILDDKVQVEQIQDIIENWLMNMGYNDVAKSYILYREKHKELRFIKDRVDWIDKYMDSSDNAAQSSETDANANVAIKNVANIDGEVYKTINRQIQRYRMTKQLEKQFPEVANQYIKDIEHHIIYPHDEASSPSVKNYCEAVSLYPILINGTKGMDGLGTTAPKNLNAFCGQLVNLTFLLSAQCKGAVAFGEFFNFLDYFCAKDFGPDYYLKPDEIATIYPKKNIKQAIHQAYQQIIYGWNQPAGNRSYQSPLM